MGVGTTDRPSLPVLVFRTYVRDLRSVCGVLLPGNPGARQCRPESLVLYIVVAYNDKSQLKQAERAKPNQTRPFSSGR